MRWLPVVLLVAITLACGPNAAPITLDAQGTPTPVPWKIEPTPTAVARAPAAAPKAPLPKSADDPSLAAGVTYQGRTYGLQGEATTWVTDSDVMGNLGPLDAFPRELNLQGEPPLAYRVRDLDERSFIGLRRIPGTARTSTSQDGPVLQFPTTGWAIAISTQPKPPSLAPLCPYIREQFKANNGCSADAKPIGVPTPSVIAKP